MARVISRVCPAVFFTVEQAMLKKINIASIKIGSRHRKDMGDLRSLAESIQEEGLLQPIGLTDRLELVFGERRLLAIRDILKRKSILARIVNVSSIIAGEFQENEIRKDFTASERVAIGKTLKEQLPERRGHPSIRQKIDELNGRTDEFVAAKAGFGNRQTFRQAVKVIESGTHRLIQAMDRGRVSIYAAALLADADPEEQDRILELDEKVILQAAQEIRRRKGLDIFIGRGQTVDWLTPRYLLDALGKFDLDPCAALDQPSKTATRQYTILDDGLTQVWRGRVWLNPPYGEQTERWLAKMAQHGNGIALVYARTETKMFFDHVWDRANGIFFLKGRLSFGKVDRITDGAATAPSILISYDPKGSRFNQTVLRRCKLQGKFLEIT
jgi:ParB family chromosome partitioning protein